MAMQKLAGQRALVTGASGGIGAELAKQLAMQGANLVITARRKERLEALADEIRKTYGVEVRVESCDLSDPAAPQQLFDATEGADLAVDVLINNAGFGAYWDFLDIDWEKYVSMIQVNIVALTHLSHLFLPPMIKRKHGYLMNVASVGAYTPCPTFAVYAASKAYVRNMTEAIGYELKGTGVNVICVNPGGTRTEFLDTADQKLKSTGEMAMMSAERCAQIAVKKMLAGRRNVITGFMNALSMFLMRFLPRPMMTWASAVGMSSAVEQDTSKAKAAPAPTESAPPLTDSDSEAGAGAGAEAKVKA